MKNPHNHLSKQPDGNWECQYCGMVGPFCEMNEAEAKHEGVEYKECTYTYPMCKSCGETPICAPDCSGVAAALAQSSVHIVGEAPPIGLMPEWLHEEKSRREEVPMDEANVNRITAINEAIARYNEANVEIPQDWLTELDVRTRLDNLRNGIKH